MPPEILALIDKPLSLIAVLFVGALAGMMVEQFVSKQRREAWKKKRAARGEGPSRYGRVHTTKFAKGAPPGWRGPWPPQSGAVAGPWDAPKHDPLPGQAAVPDAADQLRVVMASDFHAQPLLNKSEKRLFEALDRLVIELAPPGWQVMAQVSLGEILKSPSKDAFLAINSKRVDLLIVDAEAKPRHAIEYQGGGHFKGAHATAARDAVKKEALRRAGIGYVEVVGGEMNLGELRKVVEKLVRQPA